MKVKLNTLRNQYFKLAVHKIYEHNAFASAEEIRRALNLVKVFRIEIENADNLFEKILDKHVEKDDNGNRLREGNKWKIMDNEAFSKDASDFDEMTADIEFEKVKLFQGLSPAELDISEFLFE